MVKPRTAPFELEPLILNDKICENCAARGLSRPSDRRAASQAARPPVLGQRPLHLPAHLLQRAALSHFAGDSSTPNWGWGRIYARWRTYWFRFPIQLF